LRNELQSLNYKIDKFQKNLDLPWVKKESPKPESSKEDQEKARLLSNQREEERAKIKTEREKAKKEKEKADEEFQKNELLKRIASPAQIVQNAQEINRPYLKDGAIPLAEADKVAHRHWKASGKLDDDKKIFTFPVFKDENSYFVSGLFHKDDPVDIRIALEHAVISFGGEGKKRWQKTKSDIVDDQPKTPSLTKSLASLYGI